MATRRYVGVMVVALAVNVVGDAGAVDARLGERNPKFAAYYVDRQGMPLARAEDNDVVYVDKSGKKRTQLPPTPVDKADRPIKRPETAKALLPATQRSEEVVMFDTDDGLIECSDLWRWSCRPSTFRTEYKQPRLWVARRQNVWWLCNGPSLKAECVVWIVLNGSKTPAPKSSTASKLPWIAATLH